ncbi:Histone-lysine N-methyltransferase SETMAR, partial [Zootermopsis nevadensis]
YIGTLKTLKKRFRRVWPHKHPAEILLLHDNARPHTSPRTREEITKLGWTVLPHPPYSPDLAPSDFHLFGPLKDAIRGTRFEDDESVIQAVRTWLLERLSLKLTVIQRPKIFRCFIKPESAAVATRSEAWTSRAWPLGPWVRVPLKAWMFVRVSSFSLVDRRRTINDLCDIALCDFFLFPKMKIQLKGWRFETIEEIQAESQMVLDRLTKKDFQGCFQAWQRRWDRCVHSQGNYFEGDG